MTFDKQVSLEKMYEKLDELFDQHFGDIQDHWLPIGDEPRQYRENEEVQIIRRDYSIKKTFRYVSKLQGDTYCQFAIMRLENENTSRTNLVSYTCNLETDERRDLDVCWRKDFEPTIDDIIKYATPEGGVQPEEWE